MKLNYLILILSLLILTSCSSSSTEEESLESSDEETSEASDETPKTDPTETSSPEETSSEVEMKAISNPGSKVRYLKGDSPLYSQPQLDSQPLKSLNKGEVVLISEQGEWAQVSGGGFLPLSSLSDKGLGRDKNKKEWGK